MHDVPDPADQPTLHRKLAQPGGKAGAFAPALASLLVLDEVDGGKETATADIADGRVGPQLG